MAALPPEVIQFLSTAGNIFALQPELLLFPTFIGSLIIPMIFNSWAMKVITSRIGIPAWGGWLVGAVTAYMTLPWGPWIALGSVCIIGVFSNWKVFYRIIFVLVLLTFLIWGMPLVYNLLTNSLMFRQ